MRSAGLPTEGLKPWTKEQKEELNRVLKHVFGIKEEGPTNEETI